MYCSAICSPRLTVAEIGSITRQGGPCYSSTTRRTQAWLLNQAIGIMAKRVSLMALPDVFTRTSCRLREVIGTPSPKRDTGPITVSLGRSTIHDWEAGLS